MASYHVKYWFESDMRDASGEIVTETIEAESPVAVAKEVEARLSRDVFTVSPSFGPAQDGGLVVINSALVRYVEILPTGPNRY
ncbi:MAG: hypothetical protein SFU56_09570 [Capsulimonadales bacterium]|nr:hypothetical protein [Capsulimonadales bacterium]